MTPASKIRFRGEGAASRPGATVAITSPLAVSPARALPRFSGASRPGSHPNVTRSRGSPGMAGTIAPLTVYPTGAALSCGSDSMRRVRASIRARWVKACGKFPRCSPVVVSISSA